MTVGSQFEQVIANVQTIAATMKSFALETQDQEARQTFEQLAKTFEGALDTLRQRQQYIISQEPQYKQ